MVTQEATFSISNIFKDEFWNKNMDPRVAHFPFMSDGFPWRIMGISLIYFIFVKHWKPTVKTTDLKGLLFIFNSFAFGTHGLGLILCLVLDRGRDGFDCTPLQEVPFTGDVTFEYVKSQSLLHLAILLLLLRIFFMVETLILLMIKGKEPSNWRIANDLGLFWYLFIGVKYYPGGPCTFFVESYLTFYIFMYGYYTLKLGYSDGQEVLDKSKKYITYLKCLWFVASFSHYLYINIHPTCQANPMVFPMSFLELAYSIGLFLSSILDYKKMKAKKPLSERILDDNNNKKSMWSLQCNCEMYFSQHSSRFVFFFNVNLFICTSTVRRKCVTSCVFKPVLSLLIAIITLSVFCRKYLTPLLTVKVKRSHKAH